MLDFDKDSQRRLFKVANDRAKGVAIEEYDERIVRILDMHPEFDSVWEQGELMASIPQEINGQVVNPFVHTVLHAIVDKQVAEESPEFVAETHRRLLEEGLDEHESLHVIISIFADIYFTSVRRGGGQFDHLQYESRLELVSVENAE
jgi:hypothetical protein